MFGLSKFFISSMAKIAKEIVHHIEYVNYLMVHYNIYLDFARFIIVREEVFQNQERILRMNMYIYF